ncbi:hypothetical protein CBR_g49230 [Chara braunii]|uniref:BEACH domain-containing protein n=1 Tax=Chara braunii TaxID=69332 RepID=A0A388M4C5_CHABU|nr:hypothetical protein CBR_g49230 [Chara braunii]|eukprot:GBG89440.1 hypothetical protein CBR_g49230 [Chara braunii]
MKSDGSREAEGNEQDGDEKGARGEGKHRETFVDAVCRLTNEPRCSGTALPDMQEQEVQVGSEGRRKSAHHFLAMEESLLEDVDWPEAVRSWQRGELSNYDYLLILNYLAGRRWGDRCFHTVMPWVIDMSVKPGMGQGTAGWRDLTKSKWRLAKGDEQLDFTYSSSETPHHISDECLSELAVCIYKARRLPLWILKQQVRSVYEPNEYPSSMSRLYEWTPDECIPEFFTDADIFVSRHEGMSDLAVPEWACDCTDFISLHRGVCLFFS